MTAHNGACIVLNMTPQEAEQRLIRWARDHEDRDALVLAAIDAGLSKHRVHVLTGLSRTTVDRIVASRDKPAGTTT